MKIFNIILLTAVLFSSCVVSINTDKSEQLNKDIPHFSDSNTVAIPVTPSHIVLEEIVAQDVKSFFNKNKYTWVVIWVTYCKPCIEKMPEYIKLMNNYKDDLNILLINNEYSIEKIQSILFNQKFYNKSYIISSDKYGNKMRAKLIDFVSELVGDTSGVTLGYPTNIIFDKDGNLILLTLDSNKSFSLIQEHMDEHF